MNRDTDTVLVVNLKTDDEQVSQILALLHDLGLPELGVLGHEMERGLASPSITLRVSSDRVVEALLALEYHGFRRARAYNAAAGVTSARSEMVSDT